MWKMTTATAAIILKLDQQDNTPAYFASKTNFLCSKRKQLKMNRKINMRRPFQEMGNRSLLLISLLIYIARPLFQELGTKLFVLQVCFLLDCAWLLCKTAVVFREGAEGITEWGFPKGLNLRNVNKLGLSI